MSLDLVRVISEQVSRDNGVAQLEYLCPWADRLDESANLVGGLQYDNTGSPSYVAPTEYPFGSGLFANAVDITPVGDFDFNNGGYLNAQLTVTFGPLNILNPYGTDGVQICRISCNISAEMIPLPSGKYEWQSSGQPLDEDTDVKPSLTAPYLELGIKVLYASKPLFTDLSNLAGQVNNDTFNLTADDSFDEATMLFLGGELEQGVNCQGQPAWTRDLKFGVRYNNGLGWQALWHPDINNYDVIQTVGGGDKPYTEGDFTALFAIS